MFKSIFVPFDNSAHAGAAADLAGTLAAAAGARVTAGHVYAAALHDRRFRQMEGGLPEEYRKEEKLTEQRDIHGSLIDRGLNLISQSYLDAAERRLAGAGLACERVSVEGKNWKRLVENISESDHDLVVMGAFGLGHVDGAVLGSVCERVARRIDRDLLIVRNLEGLAAGPILVALDGSGQSFGGLKTALWLGRVLGRPVEAVAVYDPHFHYKAFNGIAEVLSPEAASVFRFKEQERLHGEIIDDGLARIYQSHLDIAGKLAAEEDVEIAATLRAGKAFPEVLAHVRERRPSLLVLGRIGVHSDPDMDLGSATENLMRLADCDILLSARTFQPAAEQVADTTMSWTEEAEARMERVPAFARNMARQAILQHAIKEGHTVVTSDVIDACLGAIMPGRASGGKCPFEHDKAS